MSDARPLWQGAPDARRFRATVMALPWIALYVAALTAFALVSGSTRVGIEYGLAGLGVLAVLAALGHAMARGTSYELSAAAVSITYGVALPKTVRIPLSRIAGVDLRPGPRGTGDIALQLSNNSGLQAPLLWPNLRLHRWRLEPALRAVPDAASVAARLAGALAAIEAPAPGTASEARATRAAPLQLAEAAD